MTNAAEYRPNTKYEIKSLAFHGGGVTVSFYEVDPDEGPVLMPEIDMFWEDMSPSLNEELAEALGAIEEALGPKHEARDGSKRMHARRIAEMVEADKRKALAEDAATAARIEALNIKAELEIAEQRLVEQNGRAAVLAMQASEAADAAAKAVAIRDSALEEARSRLEQIKALDVELASKAMVVAQISTIAEGVGAQLTAKVDALRETPKSEEIPKEVPA